MKMCSPLDFFQKSMSGKIYADAHGCTDFDLILGVKRMVMFGSNISSHSKTINAKLFSLLNLYTKRSHQKALKF